MLLLSFSEPSQAARRSRYYCAIPLSGQLPFLYTNSLIKALTPSRLHENVNLLAVHTYCLFKI